MFVTRRKSSLDLRRTDSFEEVSKLYIFDASLSRGVPCFVSDVLDTEKGAQVAWHRLAWDYKTAYFSPICSSDKTFLLRASYFCYLVGLSKQGAHGKDLKGGLNDLAAHTPVPDDFKEAVEHFGVNSEKLGGAYCSVM